MIHQHTMSLTKQSREDMFIGVTTSNINSLTNYNEHVPLTSMVNDATSLIVPSGPYTHIRILPLLASFSSSAGFRVTGWSKLRTSYYPTLLFVGTISGVKSSTMLSNNSVDLKGVYGISVPTTSSYPMGANSVVLNATDTVGSVASVVVPVFGCSFVEVDFTSATATTAFANILYSYCSIG